MMPARLGEGLPAGRGRGRRPGFRPCRVCLAGGRTLPPSMDDRTLMRIPSRYRDDAAQEAWLAYLAHRNPNTAAAAYMNRCRRREARWRCFTDLDSELLDAILHELPA